LFGSHRLIEAWIAEKPLDNLSAISDFVHSRFFGAMSAAIDCLAGFHAMAQNAAATMGTGRRELVNCAFEAVERMILPA
jgi:hypothetical protein